MLQAAALLAAVQQQANDLTAAAAVRAACVKAQATAPGVAAVLDGLEERRRAALQYADDAGAVAASLQLSAVVEVQSAWRLLQEAAADWEHQDREAAAASVDQVATGCSSEESGSGAGSRRQSTLPGGVGAGGRRGSVLRTASSLSSAASGPSGASRGSRQALSRGGSRAARP